MPAFRYREIGRRGERLSRVLIGGFGAIARLGLRDVLDEEGFDVVAEQGPPDQLLELLTTVRPDVVLLDLDTESSVEFAGRISIDFPAVKVIACSPEDSTMRVFPPFHRGESYVSQLDPIALAETVRS
jgi:DNA-binding NarL/FixJ family response regulator